MFLSYQQDVLQLHVSSVIECKKDGKDHDTMQLSATPDPGYLVGK